MILLIVLVFALISLWIGKCLFGKAYNPIAVYVIVWATQILLYAWRLIRYPDLHPKTWIMIALAFFCFLAGCLAIHLFRTKGTGPSSYSVEERAPWYLEEKSITLLIYGTGVIGVVGAFQHWSILLKEFGSVGHILLNAPRIYRMRVAGELEGMVPYVTSFLNISLFFAGLHTARTGRLSVGLFLSFIGVILDDLANMGREGMIFALFEVLSIVFLYHVIRPDSQEKKRIQRRLVYSMMIIVVLVFSSATLIKSLRSGREYFKGMTMKLDRFQRGTVFSPSIYLYFSSQIVVFDKYLEKETEDAMWGENTLLPFYNLLAKFGLVKKPRVYQRGYYIPVWTNTGTYLREIHADFGDLGIVWFPFLLGVVMTWLWKDYQESRNMNAFVPLVYLFIVLFSSFLMMITRSAKWWISLGVVMGIINAREIMRFLGMGLTAKGPGTG